MKRESIRLSIIISIVGFIFSCSPEYVPNMVNTPMFNNKGEIQANVATGTSFFDAQLAFSVTNHIGIISNLSFADRTNDSTDEFHKHLIVEGGIGYYEKIGRRGRFEIFGGYGVGEVKGFNSNWLVNKYADATFSRIFIQPSIGTSSNAFDGSFSPRICLVSMDSDAFSVSGFNTFFEPTFTAKVGYRYVKAIVQAGLSFPVGRENRIDFEYQPFIFNI